MGSSPLKQPHKSPEAQAPPVVPPGRPYPGGGQGGTARWKGAPGAAGRQGVTSRPWCQCNEVGNPLWERAGMAAGRAGAASQSPCLALPSSSTAGVVFHAETYEAQTFPLLSPKVGAWLQALGCDAASCQLLAGGEQSPGGSSGAGSVRRRRAPLPARPLRMRAGGLHLAGRTGLSGANPQITEPQQFRAQRVRYRRGRNAGKCQRKAAAERGGRARGRLQPDPQERGKGGRKEGIT